MSRGKGASAMDAYDKGYERLEYDYERTDADLPLKILIFRKALYVTQMVMCIGAVVVMAAASVAQHNGLVYSQVSWGTMDKGLIYVPLACGCVSVVTAFVGCVGMVVSMNTVYSSFPKWWCNLDVMNTSLRCTQSE